MCLKHYAHRLLHDQVGHALHQRFDHIVHSVVVVVIQYDCITWEPLVQRALEAFDVGIRQGHKSGVN